MYPRIVINLDELKKNLDGLAGIIKEKGGSSLAIVTKSVCADPGIVKLVANHPAVEYIADSRIQNIASFTDLAHEHGKKTMMLRIPMECELTEIVRYVDLCQISEIENIEKLNSIAASADKVQEILLMIDMGDLREGIFFRNKEIIHDTVKRILEMKNIKLAGISVNLSCYGGIVPKPDNLGELVQIGRDLEKEFGIKLEIISGGNSSSIYLFINDIMPEGINNLRIGEGFVLGNDTSNGSRLPGLTDKGFTLQAQIVELQEKPSMPIGEIGLDAFGNKPEFEDRGMMKRAIIAVGKQDVDPADITPLDDRIEIMGGSSDHIILNLSKCGDDYKLGDIVEFRVVYGALLKLMTSAYIEKVYEPNN